MPEIPKGWRVFVNERLEKEYQARKGGKVPEPFVPTLREFPDSPQTTNLTIVGTLAEALALPDEDGQKLQVLPSTSSKNTPD